MAVGERCPACGHMPGEEQPRAKLYEPVPFDAALGYAVELTRASTVLGEPANEIADRLTKIYAALKGLNRVEKPAEPAP